jgi:hypothetical protein
MDNYFLNNIGMKVHNGGALSAYCHYIDSPSYEDYPAQSLINLTKSQVSSTSYYNASAITVTSIADNSVIAIQRYKFNVRSSYNYLANLVIFEYHICPLFKTPSHLATPNYLMFKETISTRTSLAARAVLST